MPDSVSRISAPGRAAATRTAPSRAPVSPKEPGPDGPPGPRVPLPSYRAGVRARPQVRAGAGSREPRAQEALRGAGPPLPPRTCREAPAPPSRVPGAHPRPLLTCAAAGRARSPPAALKPGSGSRGGAEPSQPRPASLGLPLGALDGRCLPRPPTPPPAPQSKGKDPGWQ